MSQREDNIKVDYKSNKERPQDTAPRPGDLLGNLCNMWGSLFMGIGEAISSAGTNQRSENAPQQGTVDCGLDEFTVRWCGSGAYGRSKANSEDSTEVSGRYQDGSRQAKLDISTGSNN